MLYFQYVLIKFYAGMGIKKNGKKRKRGKKLYIIC